MRSISDVLNPFVLGRRKATRWARRVRRGPLLERLESRYALAAVAPSNFPIQLVQNGTELTITYSQPDPANGFTQTSDQHVVIDIDEYFPGIGAPTQRVNVYASTDPNANFGAPVAINKTFLGITAIHVTVPNYDAPGVDNNSLTIKGINGPTDRIIVSGSGRTAAGRWSDEAAPQLQTVFDIAGIDDLTVTAGGVINVSGAFTNDTGDASIHAIGEIAERQADQTTATIIIGETTPPQGSLPHARLVSNYIEVIGAELDIYSDIEATGHVILRQPATTPQTARANLILPYDITVTDPDGVLELHSTRNIVQLQSATFIAHKCVAISNIGDINLVDATNSTGPWLIDLGSVNNDFDTISVGMVSNAIDTPTTIQGVDARGRIGVRDIDDLTVADFGVLATTGIVTIRSVGALTVDAAVQASGLTLQSDTSVASTPRAIMSINSPTVDAGAAEPVVYTDLGVTIDVSTASGTTASGDVTLDGRIVMDLNNVREDDGVTNKTSYGGLTIHAAGETTLNSQVLTLGDIRVFSKLGITVAGQLQAGGTFVSKNGTKTELVASDLSLTTATGGITVTAPAANLPLPTTLSATNLLAMDAGGDISIAGSLFAGTIYGNTAKLPENNTTLPSITIRTAADVDMAQTAVLKTSAYGTNYNASPNPQIGLITISDANTVTSAATITADGALTFSTRGDITLSGPATARERIWLRTQTGNIDLQGSLRSTGAAYTVNAAATPPFVVPESWTPDVVLDAPNGAIATSDTGTLTSGTLTLGGVASYGAVRASGQQDITIGADVLSSGGVSLTSKLGQVTLDALVRAANGGVVTISAGNGVSQGEFSRIVGGVAVTNTAVVDPTVATDILLNGLNNSISDLTVVNLAEDGVVQVNNSVTSAKIGAVSTAGAFTYVNAGSVAVTGSIRTADRDNVLSGASSITIRATVGDLNVSSGSVGVTSVLLVSGGRGYSSSTTVAFAAPAAPPAGVTPYPAYGRPVIVNGVITAIEIVSPGQGYTAGEQVAITITDPAAAPGTGAVAVGVAALPSQSLYANDDITLEAAAAIVLAGRTQAVDGTVRVLAQEGVTVQSTMSSDFGSISLASRNGALAVNGNVVAAQRATLNARLGITQTNPIVAKELVATNTARNAIALTNNGNDVDNFAASNPIGAVTYVDADGFETGVNRAAPLGVEVRGTAVTLSSVEPYSRVRVVSGLAYNTLSIAAGTQSGTTVGTVEFVPTSKGDNPAAAGATPAFAGALRDMIRYVNDNTAVYTVNATNRSQPMALVFDEAGFPVDEIKLSAALPTFNRAVSIEGGRLENTVLTGGQTRLGITVNAAPSSLPYGLSFAPAIPAVNGKSPAYPGSTGSRIDSVAVYGFTRGSALVLGSANNTVTNVFAGLKADGTADASTPNFIGLDVTGMTATGNQVGTAVFDTATVNRFGGNTSAGILIRNGASGTRVYGSFVGDPLNLAGLPTATPANGDGIRISAATGNQIGTPDAVQPDQTDSVSNVIAGNTGSGISIVNSVGGSLAAASVVRNNLISGNRVGVGISGSKFAVLGDATGESANVIVLQKADGVAIANSQNVQLFGNLVGITPATPLAGEALAGNLGNGVSVSGTSQAVQIANGNRISANTGHGVSITTGVTAVTITGNTIGGLLDDGVTAAGNGADGVAINAAVGNTVGAGNVISRNGRHGVSLLNARAATLTAGNRIFGSTVASNANHGIYVSGGSFSTVGGTGAADGNVIQTNGNSGIFLERSGTTGAPTSYAIQGNFVGTNTNRDVDATLGNFDGGIVVVDGAATRIERNTVMNNGSTTNDGISLVRGSGSVVGGTTAAQGNLVANNVRDGISVLGSQAATGHWITGNTIVDNGDLGGGTGSGVTVTGAFARSITVGQSVTTAGVRGLGNVIQRNGGSGVRVLNGAQQVSIQGNLIADNAPANPNASARGIFIDSISNDSASRTSISIRSVVLQQPVGSQRQILLQGSVTNAVAGQQYTIDIYANSPPFGVGFPPAASAPVQAQRFLGRVTVTATASGTITWDARNPLRISANVARGEYITATVTALRIQPGSTSNPSRDSLGRVSWGVLVR